MASVLCWKGEKEKNIDFVNTSYHYPFFLFSFFFYNSLLCFSMEILNPKQFRGCSFRDVHYKMTMYNIKQIFFAFLSQPFRVSFRYHITTTQPLCCTRYFFNALYFYIYESERLWHPTTKSYEKFKKVYKLLRWVRVWTKSEFFFHFKSHMITASFFFFIQKYNTVARTQRIMYYREYIIVFQVCVRKLQHYS